MASLSTYPQELAAKIREARERANLSQAEFAQQLGVSLRTVQNWEAAQPTFPRPKHRRALAAFLDANGSEAA